MRYLALVALLVLLGVSGASAASKHTLKFHSQTTVVVSESKPLDVLDTSTMVADLANAGDAYLSYASCSSGGTTVNCLDVNIAGGSLTALPPLPGGSSTAAAANQSVGIQAYDGTTNMVPLQETAGALNVNGSGVTQPVSGTVAIGAGTNSIGRLQASAGHWAGVLFSNTVGGSGTLNGGVSPYTQGCAAGPAVPCAYIVCSAPCTLYGFMFLSGAAMVASQTVTCYNSATTLTGSYVINAAQMGSDQMISVGGANGVAASVGVTCQLNGTLLTGGASPTQDFVVFTQP